MPPYGLTFDTWWYDPQKEASLKQKISTAQATGTDSQPAPAAPAQTAPAAQTPATPAPATTPAPTAAPAEPTTPPADRGSTPIPYILGGIAVAIIAFVLGRRGRKK
jgi:hypothetical protein